MKLEITIPVLNEERTLKKNILKARTYINDNVTNNFSIVIADNGSIDNTKNIAIKLENMYDNIKYISVGKIGVGLALRTSWMQSEADIVGYMDLDLATDLEHLKEVYELFNKKNVSIINGSRLLPSSKVNNRTMFREITSRGFNLLVKSILRVKLSDGMCGFKFFKREIAQKLIKTGINTDAWFFSTEILVKAIWSGIEIIELPLLWTDMGDTRVKIFKSICTYLTSIIKLKMEKDEFISRVKGDDK